ncbi:hypothetical protein VNO77_12763 [Canavalia gladiata]|uniref:Uncharacterized protein n=1 Tax=Canavalia gladiata TaxID=3824 RepID=A0AAN9LXP9_CANGL
MTEKGVSRSEPLDVSMNDGSHAGADVSVVKQVSEYQRKNFTVTTTESDVRREDEMKQTNKQGQLLLLLLQKFHFFSSILFSLPHKFFISTNPKFQTRKPPSLGSHPFSLSPLFLFPFFHHIPDKAHNF